MLVIKIFRRTNKIICTVISTFWFKTLLIIYRCNFGKNIQVIGKVYIRCDRIGAISIGNSFKLISKSNINLVGITNIASFQCIKSGIIDVGDNCSFTSTIISSKERIIIGNYVMIGANVRILDHDYHSKDYIERRDPLNHVNSNSAPIIIEDDVFIGTNSIILKGTKVGARSIIGAGSVVSIKTIPPDSLVIGNPAIIVNKPSKDND